MQSNIAAQESELIAPIFMPYQTIPLHDAHTPGMNSPTFPSTKSDLFFNLDCIDAGKSPDANLLMLSVHVMETNTCSTSA